MKKNSAVLFFAVTLAWTWLFWGAAILIGKPLDQSPTALLMALGGIGPMAAALILLFSVNDAACRREFASRLFDPRRIPVRWAFVILLFTPALTFLAFLLSVPLFGAPLTINTAGEFLNRSLPAFLWLAVFTLFFGPVPEEIGWRGYALDRLQGKYTALTSALILAFIWAAWHFPLCLIEGTYQNSLGLGSPLFWRYFLNIIPESIFITWVYNHTRRSTLAAVLFHFITNFNPVEGIFANQKAGAAFLPAENTMWLLFGLRILAALMIILFLMKKNGAPKALPPSRDIS